MLPVDVHVCDVCCSAHVCAAAGRAGHGDHPAEPTGEHRPSACPVAHEPGHYYSTLFFSILDTLYEQKVITVLKAAAGTTDLKYTAKNVCVGGGVLDRGPPGAPERGPSE